MVSALDLCISLNGFDGLASLISIQSFTIARIIERVRAFMCDMRVHIFEYSLEWSDVKLGWSS
jgi:hypothetical protein